MKIEKLNENQIRCTLTHADLAARHLKLSELAYGTEKAKSLFRDMMQQASFDFGFEAEDLPLMIEAIPSSGDSIVLIITKVEDPEELDTRFSKFTQSMDSEASPTEQLEKLEGAEDFLNLLNKVKEAAADIKPASKPQEEPAPLNVRLFSFNHIDLVIQAAHLLAPAYHGSNTLYRDCSCISGRTLRGRDLFRCDSKAVTGINASKKSADLSFTAQSTLFYVISLILLLLLPH